MSAAELVLRRDGVDVILQHTTAGLPWVLYWGAGQVGADATTMAEVAHLSEPAVPHNALDEPWPLTIMPSQADGWLGRPGLTAHRGGEVIHPRWHTRLMEHEQHRLRLVAHDEEAGIELHTCFQLHSGGLLGIHHTLVNTAPGSLEVAGLEAMMPLPDSATHVMDFTGRWANERVPQQRELGFGTHLRASRRGRTGHDAATTMYAGSSGFANHTGELWGVHVGFSGNHIHAVERLPEGAGGFASVLSGGELLEPGEIVLDPGEEYRTPWVYFTCSNNGLDTAADRFHRYLRSRDHHPRSPRPLVLNTWEAVYLNHDEAHLLALAERAADVGIERFVLDDGWFHGRRNGLRRGLGDWWFDELAWPNGPAKLAEHVRARGMELGLWVEPEMVNPDSELVRAHPEWLLAHESRWPRSARHQLILDVARPEVADYLATAIGDLVRRYRIDFLKWDHNRDIHEARHLGAAGVHRQTLGAYALMDRLRSEHPDLEIESCASGGARIDLGVLEHTDRVWVSDTNDPVERQRIQRWTSALLPLELQGTHIGPPEAYTTGRRTSLQFRALTALFGHAGIEWDITTCNSEELALLKRWAAMYRELRPCLHTGELVNADVPDAGVILRGVVAPDASHAIYVYARLGISVAATGQRLRLPGLGSRHYTVAIRRDLGEVETISRREPPWTRAPVTASGDLLRTVGLAAPQLRPESAMLIEVTA